MLTLLHLVERERGARRLDGMRDERHLAHLLVRRHYEALQDEGIAIAEHGHAEIEPDGRKQRPATRCVA